MPNTTEGSHHEFHGGKKLTSSYFFQTPRLRSQQYRHKAKSGQAIIDRSWFKAPKQANAHNSTGYKFIAVVLWVRKPDSCSYSGLVPYWHNLVDDILDCSSSRDTVSRDEVAPVETCPDPCLRCDMFLLIHFASGVRNKKRYCCSSLLVLLRLEWFTWLGFLHAHVPEFCWNQCTYTGSVSRLVEENRPKTSVQWKKMK